jgi:hypothetical protein
MLSSVLPSLLSGDRFTLTRVRALGVASGIARGCSMDTALQLPYEMWAGWASPAHCLRTGAAAYRVRSWRGASMTQPHRVAAGLSPRQARTHRNTRTRRITTCCAPASFWPINGPIASHSSTDKPLNVPCYRPADPYACHRGATSGNPCASLRIGHKAWPSFTEASSRSCRWRASSAELPCFQAGCAPVLYLGHETPGRPLSLPPGVCQS